MPHEELATLASKSGQGYSWSVQGYSWVRFWLIIVSNLIYNILQI